MSQFNIYFFKKKSRKIDLEELVSFFEKIEGFKVEMDDESVRFNYLHPQLHYGARFIITPKSKVPDIYRLSPKYLDLNFRLEVPILTPDFVAENLFDIVKKMCNTFDFHIYNEMFEDVLQYKYEVVKKVFQIIKDAYVKKNHTLSSNYNFVEKAKLQDIFRYLNDQYVLQEFYKELQTYVPKYHFLTNENKELVIGIEWKESTLTVFPPYVDYLFYSNGDKIKVVAYQEAIPLLEKYLEDVPGFIKGTKVVVKKNAKKVYRIMKKTKFAMVKHKFSKISIKKLMD